MRDYENELQSHQDKGGVKMGKKQEGRASRQASAFAFRSALDVSSICHEPTEKTKDGE